MNIENMNMPPNPYKCKDLRPLRSINGIEMSVMITMTTPIPIVAYFACFSDKPVVMKNHCLSRNVIPISALKKLRNSTDIEDDIDEMRAEEQAQRAEAKITMLELVKSPTLRLPLVIAIVMQLSQQLSGINAVSVTILYFLSVLIQLLSLNWS